MRIFVSIACIVLTAVVQVEELVAIQDVNNWLFISASTG
jgi:hypothetical protein